VRAHVALGTATALSLFVDLQLLPFAVLGGMVYMVQRRRRHASGLEADSRDRSVQDREC
jgi:hypothetical protein